MTPTATEPIAADPAETRDRPDLTGTGMSYRDQPVAHHGAELDPVLPDRSVITVPGRTWPAARPEQCTYTGLFTWINDLLVCPGCGLDGS